MKRVAVALIVFLGYIPLQAQDIPATPIHIDVQIPSVLTLKGEHGDKGDQGPSGPQGQPGPQGIIGPIGMPGLLPIKVSKFKPIIGGDQGESGQAYRYQDGTVLEMGPLVVVWVYIQFEPSGGGQGIINGNLVLKNLPVVAGHVQQFYGGFESYVSNLSPNAPKDTIFPMISAGNGFAFLRTLRSDNSNPQNMNSGDVNPASQFMLTLLYLKDQ